MRFFICTFVLAALLGCDDETSSTPATAVSSTSAATSGSGGDGTGGNPSEGGAGGMSYEGVDPIEGAPDVELVQGGFSFTEGTVWLASLGVLRFSDIPANRIHEYDQANGMVTIWREPSGNTNGNAVMPNGDIVMCEQQGRRVSRSPAAGAPMPTTLADAFRGGTFNAPNDVIARSDGTIYLTDPTYGLQGPPDIPFRGVFRVTPNGEVMLVDDMHAQPNGIALSPDEGTLYVTDSEAGGLFSYPVATDGSTSPGTELINAAPSDGMAVDDAGNLYLTTAMGVEVYRDDGTPWGVIDVPEQPANCAFGGADRKTLFITARTGLYQVPLNVPGKP